MQETRRVLQGASFLKRRGFLFIGLVVFFLMERGLWTVLLLLAAVSADAAAIPRRVRISGRRFVLAATGENIVLQV
jgi:hypothetical protein